MHLSLLCLPAEIEHWLFVSREGAEISGLAYVGLVVMLLNMLS